MECFEFCEESEAGSNVHQNGKLININTQNNLYVSNIPKHVGEDKVKKHFSQYGEISSVNIREKKTNREKLYGFVTFKETESASRALNNQPHVFGSHRVTVKAAVSWKQPSITKLETNSSDQAFLVTGQCPEGVHMDQNSILKLNDDCLLHIFSFLPLNKQFQLSTLCERFQSIFEMIFRRKKSLNNEKENLTFMEVRQIITQVGHHIEESHLEGYGNHNAINHSCCLKLMLNSCPKLRSLELSAVRYVDPDIYRLISLRLINLTKIELRNCSITDQVLNHLSHLPELESLDISRNFRLTGKFLDRFPKLARINLSLCTNIQSTYFSELCKKGQLKSLNINRCDNLNKSNFMEMEYFLENLEDLVISTCYKTDDLFHIAGLKNLKELTINYWTQSLQDSLFASLSYRKANTLETLVLVASILLSEQQKEYICSLKSLKKLVILGSLDVNEIFLRQIACLPELRSLYLARCPIISRTDLAALFEKSNNLQHVDISYCNQICAEAIFEIVKKIKESKRASPCTLYISKTNIPDDIIMDKRYLECAQLLPLSFKIPEFYLTIDSDYKYSQRKHRVNIRALKNQRHVFGAHRVTVKAANSWKQPPIAKLEESSSDKASVNGQCHEENHVNENSILRLNDDCLLHIFSFLPLNKQFQLSALCKRFHSIFEMIFRRKKSLSNENENLKLVEVTQIIAQVGHHIEEIHLEGYGDYNAKNHARCLEYMSHSCQKLRVLELSDVRNIGPDTYRLISVSLKNLTMLELRYCSITDQVLNHLSHLPELEYLDVSRNHKLTGIFLDRFPKLARLNLSQCANIEPKHFSELCKKRQLKSLNINRCYNLEKSNFMEMESLLDNLENLVISSLYETCDLYHIAGLKNLKELTINDYTNYLHDSLFESLAKRKGNTLETFILITTFAILPKRQKDICSLKSLKKLGILGDTEMNDRFLRQIASLPQLTSLNLSGLVITRTGLNALFEKANNLRDVDISNCHQVCAQAIFNIVKKIKESKRTSPCTLYIGNTNIPDDIIMDERYLECAKLLPLSFEICEPCLKVDLHYTYRPQNARKCHKN